MRTRTAPIERMLRRRVIDSDGCWIWPGAHNSLPDRHGGGNYGQIMNTATGTSLLVHRVSYEHFVGPIPMGFVVDHNCHNQDSSCPGNGCKHRRCWNPAHLRAISAADNCAAGRAPGAITKRTGLCKRGHAQTDDNVDTWIRPSGTVRRTCKQCRRDSQRRQREVKRHSGTSE